MKRRPSQQAPKPDSKETTDLHHGPEDNLKIPGKTKLVLLLNNKTWPKCQKLRKHKTWLPNRSHRKKAQSFWLDILLLFYLLCKLYSEFSVYNSSVFSINTNYVIVSVKHEGLQKGVLNELWIHHIHYSNAFGSPVSACTDQLTCFMHFQLSHRNRNIILLKYAQINEKHPVISF